MQLIELLILGIALGTDAFSVSVAVGMNRFNWKLVIKLSLIIGILHVLMPLAGISLAQILDYFFGYYYFEETLEQITTIIGAALLMLLGMIMIFDSRRDNDYNEYCFNLSAWTIIILSISVSIDALSVGFSLGMLEASVFFSSLILGLIAALMVVLGLSLGSKVGLVLASRAQIAGGIALILLGVNFLFS